MYSVKINETSLKMKEFEGQRVVTLKDIDLVHQRTSGTARKRFNDNKKHFILNEDYFVRKTDEAKKEFGITAPNGLILITETGYLMLVKSFTDDLAWEVQRTLVKCYFRAKEEQPSTTIIPKTWKGEPVLFYKDIMAMTNIRKNDIDKFILNNAPIGGISILTHYGLPKFKEENPHLEQYLKYTNFSIGIITKDGALKLLKGCDCSTADINTVMDYYNNNKTDVIEPVNVSDDSEYIYQKIFLSLDKSNQNKVLSEMIKLHEEQKENEKKVDSFFKRNPKRKQQKVLSVS